RGALNVEALSRAFQEIARRHEALRTTFELDDDGNAVAVAQAPPTFDLPISDLGGLDEAERETAVQHAVAHDAAAPFDLERGPLLRVALLRLATDDHVLLFTMHHIVSDGWSMGIFVDEMR